MTTYKAQIKDENGNTVIPAIGPVQTNEIADGAITTAKIDDEAVISSKIDFTTITSDASNLPVAYQSVSLGHGFVCDLRRVGNVVFMSKETSVASAVSADMTRSSLAEVIPSGFRPAGGTSFASHYQDGANYTAVWEVSQSGAMNLTTRGSYGGLRYGLNASWITIDTYPSA